MTSDMVGIILASFWIVACICLIAYVTWKNGWIKNK